MIKKITPYIYILFLAAFSNKIIAQEINLKIISKDSLENTILNKLDYKKKHISTKSIQQEINSISNHLKVIGYFNNRIDSSTKKDSTHTTIFDLGLKIEKIIINSSQPINNLTKLKARSKKIELKTEKITNFLNSISNKLENLGEPFSKVKLENISIKNNTLYADLKIDRSSIRKIDSVIIKGYKNFPKPYINHYYKISNNTIFNQKKLKEISTATKSLSFIEEIKPPKILFSKDSTLLYMYIKKKKLNSFDGLLSFNSNENKKGVTFNGHLNLELNNILNKGEHFNLTWKANGDERQSFEASTTVPYIFNLPFTPSLKLNIYKQDSTFLNAKFSSKLQYSLSNKISINLTLDSESSTKILKENKNSNIENYKSTFYGVELIYKTPNKNPLFKNTFLLKINPSFGNRKTDNLKTNQFKTTLQISYILKIKERNYLYLKNTSGILNSNNYVENELFRIGGANTIRGINEESIFTPKFTSFNIEYRYLTSKKSYLYSITDLGFSKTTSFNNQRDLSIGLGYLFPIKNSYLNTSYVFSKERKSSLNITLNTLF